MICCTTMGHEFTAAAGEALVEDGRWHPYCVPCLEVSDPPIRVWNSTRGPMPTGVVEGWILVEAIENALLTHSHQISPTSSSRRLDANTRNLIATLAVEAVFEVFAGDGTKELAR